MNNIEKQVDSINSKDDFLRFMNMLTSDFRNNGASWENKTLPDYLDAIERWTESIEHYYINNGIKGVDINNVNWRVFADILLSATIYE
jgi:hypothetical protein